VNGDRNDSPNGFPTTAGDRFTAHGWTTDARTTGYVVRLAQPLRGLIPLLLDDAAPAEMVDGVRLFECPWIQVDPDAIDVGTVEGTETDANLAISNVAPDDEDLTWTITEATDDCSSPTDLPWASTSTSGGTTGAGNTSNVTVSFDAAGLTAPDHYAGLLCIASNDVGDPLVAVPISLQVQYPFGGFQPPIDEGFNSAKAGSTVPVKFDIGGDRGLEAVTAVMTVEVDCDTLEWLGSPTLASSTSGLVWDGEKYQFDWKTSKSFAGECRAAVLVLADSTPEVPNPHVAYFEFF
jgi:hypothetical protein